MQAPKGTAIRQPAVSSWYPNGVGSVVSNTTVIYHPGKRRKAHHVTGSAAMTMMRLQLQYLVFLKQSDAVVALKQKAQTPTPA